MFLPSVTNIGVFNGGFWSFTEIQFIYFFIYDLRILLLRQKGRAESAPLFVKLLTKLTLFQKAFFVVNDISRNIAYMV